MSCEELKIVDKMGRPPCCDKSNVKKGLWTAEEDMKLLAYVSKHGPGNWTAIPKKAGLKRCGKSCRLRWTNYLRPDLRHEGFTQEEEQMIIILHATIGSRWSHIAAQLPGRTDNDVKNYWNTKLRKKLWEMGIDPVTHKPFSQVIADYGNIGLPRVTTPSTSRIDPSRPQTSNITRISCLNRDLRNAFMPKPPPSQSLISNFSLSTSMTTEMLPTQDSLLNNQYPTWDLFAQIQAIKLVADASNSFNNQETLQSHFSIEGSSPSSSSSSSSSSSISGHQHSIQTAAYLPLPSQPYQAQSEDTPSPSSFNWSEYLSEDAFQQDPSSDQMQDDMFSPIPKLDFIGGEKNQYCNGFADVDGCAQVVHGYNNNMMGGDPTDILGADSGNSFVESILDRDSEMLLEFPDILDDP